MLHIENIYTPTPIDGESIKRYQEKIDDYESAKALIEPRLNTLRDESQTIFKSSCVTFNQFFESLNIRTLKLTSYDSIEYAIELIKSIESNQNRTISQFFRDKASDERRQFTDKVTSELTPIRVKLYDYYSKIDALKRQLQMPEWGMQGSQSIIHDHIHKNLWSGIIFALDKIITQCKTHAKTTNNYSYTNISDVADELKKHIKHVQSLQSTSSEKLLQSLEENFLLARTKGRFERTTDDFSKKHIKLLEDTLSAHKQNCMLLQSRNYAAFQEIVIGLPRPNAELSNMSHGDRDPEAFPGIKSPIIREIRATPVKVAGFFERHSNWMLAGKTLIVASLPTVAYFCIQSVNEFVLNLPLPAAVSLALASLFLAAMAYQYFKPEVVLDHQQATI